MTPIDGITDQFIVNGLNFYLTTTKRDFGRRMILDEEMETTGVWATDVGSARDAVAAWMLGKTMGEAAGRALLAFELRRLIGASEALGPL